MAQACAVSGFLLILSPKTVALLLIGIVGLALGTRLAVAMLTTSWVFPSDGNFWSFGHEMGQIAASLAMGNGFSWPHWSNYPQGPTAWMAPVHPLLMAGAFKVFGIYSERAAIALEVFLTSMSALTCILLYCLGKHLYNAKVGLLSASLLAIYPPSINYAVRSLWETTLFTGLLLIIILMFLKLANHPHIKGGIALGSTMGFTALVNPIIVSAYPFAIAWLYMKSQCSRATILKMTTLTLIAFFLVISPWLVRNYVVFGKFVFIKSNFGYELYKGTNQSPTYTVWDAINRRTDRSEVFTEVERELLERSNEATRNAFLLQKAITFIVENPGRFAQQTMTRFVTFWTFTRHQSGFEAKVALIAYLSVLILAVAGLFLSKAKKQNVYLVLLFVLCLPLPYYFTIVSIFRYRFPIEPLLIVFAAYTIYRLMVHLQGKRECVG
jgi:4-amino-4-deoxy-L-arabinose transferase-like glycosyltransferase